MTAAWRALSRWSAYRLMTVSLAVMVAASVLFGALGLVGYDPRALLATLAALLLASLASGWLFARIAGNAPHLESSVITALILYFLLWPSDELLGLGGGVLGAASAAILANASKYVLTLRGRPLLNPAAFGAAVLSLVGLGGAAWWVATPAMLPFVLVLGGLLVWRVRLGWTAAAYLVPTLVAAFTIALAAMPAGGAAWAVVSMYPFWFFAAFMLTEPHTLPARTWQRVAVALVAAAAWLVSALWLSMPYEATLLVANLFSAALAWRDRGRTRARVVSARALPGHRTELTLEPARPGGLDHAPGQYLELTLGGVRDWRGSRRVFSIMEGPEPGQVRIATAVPPEGASAFKRRLGELRAGDAVTVSAIGGGFLAPNDPAIPLLLVAQGIGITPFVSFAQRYARQGRDLSVLWAPGDLRVSDFPGLSGATVMVTNRTIDRGLLRDAYGDIATRMVYVSGAPGFVQRVAAEARRAGARKIVTDYFFGT